MLRITGDKYEQYQAYPREIFDVPGFRDWVETGYYKYLADQKKTPYKVLKQPPHLRDKEDLRIFKEYCQRFELLADRHDEFYHSLNIGVRVCEDFKKGDIIEPDPSVVRILWQGLVEPAIPAHSYKKRKSVEGQHFLFLPRHTLISNDLFADPLVNRQCHCEVADCNCHEVSGLVFFEIEFERLNELLKNAVKEEISQMVVFLTQIDIFLKVSNRKLEFAASKVQIRECKKGELILTKDDFPLDQFFIVKKGKVNLYKQVTVERTNFMPTTKESYQKRSYKKQVLHALGAVRPGQYYGVIESLMEMHEGQVTCPYAKAAEDTTLVYFNKIDFVNTFSKDQIGEMLDVVKAQKLIKDVPADDLVLRTMHKDKVLEMCKPRERVYKDRDTPRRIKKIIMDHQSTNAFRVKQLQSYQGKRAKERINVVEGEEKVADQLPKKNMVVPRNKWAQPIIKRAKICQDDDDRMQEIARADFQTSQQFIRGQKRNVAQSTITQLFKRDNWTIVGYHSTADLLTDYNVGFDSMGKPNGQDDEDGEEGDQLVTSPASKPDIAKN